MSIPRQYSGKRHHRCHWSILPSDLPLLRSIDTPNCQCPEPSTLEVPKSSAEIRSQARRRISSFSFPSPFRFFQRCYLEQRTCRPVLHPFPRRKHLMSVQNNTTRVFKDIVMLFLKLNSEMLESIPKCWDRNLTHSYCCHLVSSTYELVWHRYRG